MNHDLLLNPLAICTDNSSTKWIRINFHYMLDDNGGSNFNPLNDGNGNPNMNAYQRTDILLNYVNNALTNNAHNWLPNPNTTLTLPTRIRFLLTGIYFHKNTSDMASYDAEYLNGIYGINRDSEINYYFTRSKIGNVELGGNGIANSIPGNSALSSCYGKYLIDPDFIPMPGALIIHEVGHVLNLNHTWNENDHCDDTPNHGYTGSNGEIKPCFFEGRGDPSCFGWSNVSNNFMDYTNYLSAFTPCQTDRMHSFLNSFTGNQFVHSCNGCTPVNAFFDLSGCFNISPPNSPYWGSEALFLNGEASVNEDKYKIIICEVSSIGSTVCMGGYFNTGLISGTVGKINLKNIYNFQGGKTYKIELEVGSSNCFSSSVQTRFVQINIGYCPSVYSSED